MPRLNPWGVTMEVTRTLTVNGREEWRSWLEANHDREREIWLVFYRKATGKQTVSLPEAQDEALCFGWVDSIEKKLDEERYALRFTPRKKGSHWSEGNLSRARVLIAEGKMTVSGFVALPAEYRGESSGSRSRPVRDIRHGDTAAGSPAGRGPVAIFRRGR